MNKSATTLLVAAALAASALAADLPRVHPPDDPVAVTLEIDPQGEAQLALSNSSAEAVTFRSDLPAVLSRLFLEFPVEGALQFRDAKGNRLKMNGESESQWWHPIVMSSVLFSDAHAEISPIALAPRSVKRFKLNCRGVLFHVAGRSDGAVASDFRWSLRFKIEDPAGKILTVRGESPWAPLPRP